MLFKRRKTKPPRMNRTIIGHYPTKHILIGHKEGCSWMPSLRIEVNVPLRHTAWDIHLASEKIRGA